MCARFSIFLNGKHMLMEVLCRLFLQFQTRTDDVRQQAEVMDGSRSSKEKTTAEGQTNEINPY